MPKLSTELLTASTCSEDELLICCARTSVDANIAERIRLLVKGDIDWEYLVQTAISHRVMPLLYKNLNITCPEIVPKIILEQLQGHFYTNIQSNLFLTGELLKLLNLLTEYEIPAIPFKGPVLAALAYGDDMLRQFYDLDILVHERDVLRIRDLLISQGYQLQLQVNWEYHFVHQNSGAIVDIHWGIMPRECPFPLDFECLWSRLEPVSLAGRMVLSLLPEDLLLILCVQVAKDHWEEWVQLSKICDVAELIRVYQALDWKRVIENAKTLGSERMLFLGLFLASELLGTALPTEILARMQASVVKALAVQVLRQLFGTADGPKYLEKSIFYFRVRERWQDRVPYLLHALYLVIAPSPKDQKLLTLPASLSFLYYLVRPIRVVGEYGRSKLKRRLGFR